MSDINVTTDDWVSLSTLSGITVGTQLKVQNKGVTSLLLLQSVTKPDITDLSGEVVSTLGNNSYESSKIVLSGGDELWCRVRDTAGGLILVYAQEWVI